MFDSGRHFERLQSLERAYVVLLGMNYWLVDCWCFAVGRKNGEISKTGSSANGAISAAPFSVMLFGKSIERFVSTIRTTTKDKPKTHHGRQRRRRR